MLPLLIGGALGIGQGLLGKSKAEAQRKLQAATQRYSPYTGLKAHEVQDPSMLGSVLGGLYSGWDFENRNSGNKPAAKNAAPTNATAELPAQSAYSPYSWNANPLGLSYNINELG